MIMEPIITIAIQFLFAFLISYAIVSDITRLLIPNWVSLCLVFLFCLYYAVTYPDISLAKSLSAMCIVFALSAALFHFGLLGGGDVKLLTVLSLWAGPGHIAYFIVLVSVIGSFLGLLVIKSSYVSDYYPGIAEKNSVLTKLTEWRSRGICPYGIAIGSAALIVAPSFFA